MSKVIITGGTRGIGKGIADAFSNSDQVVVSGKNKIIANDTDSLKTKFANFEHMDEVVNFLKYSLQDLGEELDILVLNAAAVDFQFKNSGLTKEEIAEKMRKVNVDANIYMVDSATEVLKRNRGTIVFLQTRFGILDNLETAPLLKITNPAVIEDIGNYIMNKTEVNKYLNDFVKDNKSIGVFVFSVIPGNVFTRINDELIDVGTKEMSEAKQKERREGRERNPDVVGKIIKEMAVNHKKFNPETLSYDIEIKNGEVIEISNAAYEFEKQNILTI